MKPKKTTLFLGLTFLMIQKVAAVCTSPAGVDGELKYIAPSLRYCDNTNWILTTDTNTAVSCAGYSAGTILYSGGILQYCNGGGTWYRTDGISIATCAGGEAGKFYYDATGKFYTYCNGSNWRKMQ